MSHDDFELEPVRGLPAKLPPGETLLWQGTPDWRSLAIRALHVRKVAVYFAVLAAWSGASAWSDGGGAGAVVIATATQLALGAAAIALLGGIAWFAARATVYSVTSERLVVRFGIALPMTVNLPFSAVESAMLRRHADGTGDLPLVLVPEQKVSYLLMWPHVRPWQYKRVQPMIRCVPEPARVAEILASSMHASLERRRATAGVESAAAPARAEPVAAAAPRIVRPGSTSADMGLGPMARA